MNITIYGSHTVPCGEFPYDKGQEFECALKNNWSAITFFHFTSINTAEVTISADSVADMTVREVYERLKNAVTAACGEIDWNIWTAVSLPPKCSISTS
jgi:hypothetical protein